MRMVGLDNFFVRKKQKKNEKMLLSYKNFKEELNNAKFINANAPKFKVLQNSILRIRAKLINFPLIYSRITLFP